jgi:paired amphipathic helix protein Sin3a
VSHPTWASEESGFVAHKKNSYEEALHKSEEERHEYQVHVDALVRTIAILEPLNARIDEMTHEERTLFKLKPDFGGSSKSIYHKIIKKIYGRDAGIEVIQALQDCPGVAVPVVLMRLKQKEDDWRRAQREWGRTWKEVDAKNFYKSLDHQGLVFKANDKKNITAKHFVHDIETVKAEQSEKEEEFSFRKSVGTQLEYELSDTSVLHDCLKMVYSFLDHNPTQYSFQERRSIERILRSFVPLLFRYPVNEFNAEFDALEEEMIEYEDVALDIDSEVVTDGRGSVSEQVQGGVLPADLRKRLLKTVREKANGRSRSTSLSPMDPEPDQRATDFTEDSIDVWTEESVASLPSGQTSAGKTPVEKRPFFCNTTFYTLLRLLQVWLDMP